jgi:hypothetical protein
MLAWYTWDNNVRRKNYKVTEKLTVKPAALLKPRGVVSKCRANFISLALTNKMSKFVQNREI